MFHMQQPCHAFCECRCKAREAAAVPVSEASDFVFLKGTEFDVVEGTGVLCRREQECLTRLLLQRSMQSMANTEQDTEQDRSTCISCCRITSTHDIGFTELHVLPCDVMHQASPQSHNSVAHQSSWCHVNGFELPLPAGLHQAAAHIPAARAGPIHP